MASTPEELLEEIHENARKDRKRLEKFCDAMEKFIDLEPVLVPDVAEGVSRLSDCLTRCNSQLVEVMKIISKKKPETEKEVDGLFDEIGDGFEREKEEDHN